MQFSFSHANINVTDMDRSVAFYEKTLGLTVYSENYAADGSYIIKKLSDGQTPILLELTWLRDHPQPYDLEDNEIHLAYAVADIDAALEMHRAQGVVSLENKNMGIYFIEDPDGYWIEIVPEK
jgi:lactoylglutathione lyase